MKPRDFRIGWRTLVQEPAYSLVVVGGLGLGFAAALLLFGFVRYSWQYNHHVPDVDNVYVVKQRYNVDPKAPWFDQAPMLLHAAAAGAPGVAGATLYLPSRPQGMGLTASVDGRLHSLASQTVLPGFASMLGVRALRGDLKAALERPEGIAITGELAERLYGGADALGRTMLVEGKTLRVDAILRTPPANTTIPFEALIGVNSSLAADVREEMLTGQQGWWGKVLIRVHPGASLPAITAALQRAVDEAPALRKQAPEVKQRLGGRKAMDIALGPLGEAYFDTGVTANFIDGAGRRANPVAVAGLGAIAVLILALAAVNYINLAAVRVLRRQREVAMRKVLGASVRRIVAQLLTESMLVSMLATLIGLLLAWMALPLFSALVDRRLDGMLSAQNIAAALALGVLLGLLTAAYPAWIAARVPPSKALAGRGGAESAGGMRLRRVMTVLQVATAMGFASVTLAIAWQTAYAMRASPGFDPSALLIIDLPEPSRYGAQARGFVAALRARPGVDGVAILQDAVGRNTDVWFRELKRPGGASVPMEMKLVSANFFEQYRIRPESGRLYDPRLDREDDPVPLILNAIAARELGFSNPTAALGQTVLFTGFDNKVVHKRVIGIAPDLRFQSLREPQRAMAYELGTGGTTLSVRAAGSPARLEAVVREVWPRYFPDAILKTHGAADILAANYAEDARMARLLALATGIALAIAAFGTYVLSAHTVQRRAREIVLRKLHGAGRGAIGLLVVREIGALTLVSAAIGLPLAAVAIRRYLATYVEHAPIGHWTLPLALACTLAIAFLAVARHAWMAMGMKPAEALRG
ncbi:FtsX-like permease family protein [Pseudoduganella namucuonensis]|uniref:FtsX-like permease family protein n=1 Tax=Pseudoduganella namucuonensis TaxID=1035707 RepID=A0A1I7G6U4_9BURK|nr:FtsX-like permease family protein [Pseudoduganella namucuonensis]SFU44138.1 FtsX-like permease family protein [Pseudoduganella namucuonensis]